MPRSINNFPEASPEYMEAHLALLEDEWRRMCEAEAEAEAKAEA